MKTRGRGLLTHPGVPCVYWKHYFDWGKPLREKIKALVNARKVACVHAGSLLYVQANACQNNVYAARVVGSNGDLYVRVGGSDDDWQPQASGYSGFREYAAGEGWRVWGGLTDNPEVQSAPLPLPFEVPEYRCLRVSKFPMRG